MVFRLLFLPFVIMPIIAIAVLFFVFWFIMFVDAITRKFKENDKIVWVLVIIFTHIIGALIYYFIVYRKHESMRWFWISILILAVLVLIVFILAFGIFTQWQMGRVS